MVVGGSQMRDPKRLLEFCFHPLLSRSPNPVLQLLAQHFHPHIPKAPESRLSKTWIAGSAPSADNSLWVFCWPYSTPEFTAALLTKARKRKKPECPSTEECIKKTGYMPLPATAMETSGFFWTLPPLTSCISSTSKCWLSSPLSSLSSHLFSTVSTFCPNHCFSAPCNSFHLALTSTHGLPAPLAPWLHTWKHVHLTLPSSSPPHTDRSVPALGLRSTFWPPGLAPPSFPASPQPPGPGSLQAGHTFPPSPHCPTLPSSHLCSAGSPAGGSSSSGRLTQLFSKVLHKSSTPGMPWLSFDWVASLSTLSSLSPVMYRSFRAGLQMNFFDYLLH